MVELRKEAQLLKKDGLYDKAIEIYSQIYSSDCDKWLGWEYAYCLKKQGQLDEAIKICKSIYSKDKNFKHNNDLLSWLLYEKYFKNTKETYLYKEVNQLFEIAIFVSEITTQDNTSPYEKIMLKTIKILKKHSNNSDDKLLKILEKIDSRKLSETAHTYKNNDREQEYQSDKEMLYAYKTKALYNKKFYSECIACCIEALSTISKFHHNNDIWIESRKILCLGEIESVDVAIEELKKISAIKTHWIFYADIARLYLSKSDSKNALLYFCRAALTTDAPQMKVTLFYEMSELINRIGDKSNAILHALYAKSIREKEGWNIPIELMTLINDIGITEEKRDIQSDELQEYWINNIYEILGALNGTVTNIHQNGKFGFIKSGKDSYYFKTISILNRRCVKQNDKVIFCIIDSFDKTKKQTTKEAGYIKLDKC